MRQLPNIVSLCAIAVITSLTVLACQTTYVEANFTREISRTSEPYDFIHNLRYKSERSETLSAYLGSPAGYSICFSEHWNSIPLKNHRKIPLSFTEGVYAFQIFKNLKVKVKKPAKGKAKVKTGPRNYVFPCSDLINKSQERYSGALVVTNLDKSVELATFGLSKETQLFKPELLKKVRADTLTHYDIKFDGRVRMSYWIGNREKLYKGGLPTVELDFSRLKIAELRINGDRIKSNVATLPAYDRIDKSQKKYYEHELYIRLRDGRAFRGYIRKIRSNPFSAFMKVPCDIPAELFNAAERGTIAKFNVNGASQTGADTSIAEIVFGFTAS